MHVAEKKEHGTLAFPFQIYPALDGSARLMTAISSLSLHLELEIITVDAGHFLLTIADHTCTKAPRRCVLRRR